MTTLAQKRLERGLTQEQLAEAAGVSRRTIIRLEGGEAPNIRTAYKLARVLEVAIGDLFDEAGAA